MQKNGILMRFISCTLALVLLVGMVPMGMVRPVEAAVSEYKVIDSSATGWYKRMNMTELKAEFYEEWGNVPSLVFSFGNYVVSDASTEGLTVAEFSPHRLESANIYLFEADNYCKWNITCRTWIDGGNSGDYQTIYKEWREDNLYYLGVNDSGMPVVSKESAWGLSDNSSSAENRTLIFSRYTSGDEPYRIGYIENGSISVKSANWGEFNSAGADTYFYVYAPVTTVYAALDATNTSYTVEANSAEATGILAKIMSENKVSFSSDSTGTDAAAYDLNTSKVGNYDITTTWDKNLDTATAGTYIMTVKANNVALGTITVEVTAPTTTYSVAVGEVSAMDIGETATAVATVTNVSETVSSDGYTLAWSSGTPSVATVNSTTGEITAVAPGTATITAEATLTDGTKVSGTTQVTVNVPDVSIIFENTTATVTVGKTVALEPTIVIKAGDTVLKNVGYTLAWESSSTGNATVSGGTVSGVAVGSANITATVDTITIGEVTVDLAEKPSAVIAVTVEASKDPALTLDKTQTTLSVGAADTVTATKVNSDAAVTWGSSNESVAVVSDGVITAKAPGTATITATLGDTGVTASMTVTVTAPVVLDVTSSELTLGAGASSENLAYSITHNSAAVSNPTATITWTSSNTNVATVDANGKITAIAGGTATITATLTGLKDGSGNDIILTDAGSNRTDTVQVTVVQATITAPDSVSLTITETEAEPTTEFVLDIGVIPSGTPNNGVGFTLGSSTDTSVATVSMDADTKKVTVTGHKVGVAAFTVTATVTLSDNSTVTTTKTISVRVNADALQQDQTPVAVGREESSYIYTLLDAAGFANSVGKKLVVSFDETGGKILVAANGNVNLTQSAIAKQTDGSYRIANGNNFSVWNHYRMDWNTKVITVYVGEWYYIHIDNDGSIKLAQNGGNTQWTVDDVSGGGVTLKKGDDALGIKNGNVAVGNATELDSATMYFFTETEIEGAQQYAALFCKDYSIPVTEFTSGAFAKILAECYIRVGTDPDLSGTTSSYALNALPANYSYVLKKNNATVEKIDSTGTYTVEVVYQEGSNSAISLGTFTITIEAPVSIVLNVGTNPADAWENEKVNVAVNSSVNLIPTVTVTMEDGTVVDPNAVLYEVRFEKTDWQGRITLDDHVVTGNNAGTDARVKAVLNSVIINGIQVLGSAASETKEQTLSVRVYNVPAVSLDTTELKNQITLDVNDAPTSQTFPLEYIAEYLSEIGLDASALDISYQVETDGDAVTVEKNADSTQYTITAAKKGTANVTVTLSIAQDYQDTVVVKTRSFTTKVTVTDNENEPYEVTVNPDSLLIGVGTEKQVQLTVIQGTRIVDPAKYTVTWSSNAQTVATVADGKITGVETGTAVVTATVTNKENSSLTDSAEVDVKVAQTNELYVLTVTPANIDATVGTTVDVTKQLTFEGDPCTDTVVWQYSSANTNVATVDADGKITLKGSGSTTVTVTATITRSDNTTVTKTKTISVNSAEPALTIGTDYSNAEGQLDEITVSAGTSFTLTPHVDVSDWLTSYTVSWEVVDANDDVVSSDMVSVTTPTLGGPLSNDVTDGIQSIGDAETTIAVSASAAVGAEYTVRAWLTEINGIPVTGTKDEIKVNVVSADAKVTLQSSFITDILNQVNDPDDTESKYEFRIKDAHTYLPDGNGLDARVIAVQGDNRIDFSNVTLNVYKDGQLVLDATTGNPIEIPASQLSFYNVETDEVGWQQVRVTWMDFYQTDIVVGENGKTATGYKYTEHTTGEDGQEGYIWMYVREPVYEVGSSTVTINGETVVVTASVSDVRPWLGAGHSNKVENRAENDPRDGEGRSDPDRHVDLILKFTYNGKEYVLKDGDDAIKGKGVYLWNTTGALISAAEATNNPNLAGRDEYYPMEYSAKSWTDIGSQPALGYFTVTWKNIVVDGNIYELDEEIKIDIPIVVRQDKVDIDNQIEWSPHDAESRWGSTQSYGFHYWLGGMPISAFAISYESDLGSSLYNIGIMDATSNSSGKGGSWLQVMNVDAPLGTGDVLAILHSVTRNDGTVVILDEGDRELDVSDAKYKLEVNPEMLILEVAGANLGFETSGEVQATITDLEGNLITTDAVVKWTLRNSSIAKVDEQGINLTYPTAGDTQHDGYFSENVPGAQMGSSDEYTMTSVSPGVTYITAQLISVGGENVESQMIADYCIIYVVNVGDELDSVDIVIDYGKPIEIQYEKLTHTQVVKNENDEIIETINYELAGFADTDHPMRKHAYTTYGEIEFFDGTEPSVIYTPLDIVDQVETVYCILQKVGTNNEWVFHKIHIIPATVVYYETDGNVSSAFDPTGSWATVGTYAAGVQDDYVSDAVNGNEIYGFDSSYNNDLNLSNESSLFVYGAATAAEVVANAPSTNVKFTFRGTGFDIIARTGDKQATIRVHVYNSSGAKVKTVSVICKGTNELYQIPVIAVRGLDYGTYDVEIIVYDAYDPWTALDKETKELFGEEVLKQLARGNEFYFDAIRIYDPVKGDLTAQAAYAADGECSQTIKQVGNLLVDLETYNSLKGTETATGAVFMDSYNLSVGGEIESGTGGFVTTTDVATYKAVGPNNEVYLGKDQGIAFILNTEGGVPDSIQIGAKSIQGDTVTLNAKLIKATTGNNTTEYVSTTYSLAESISTGTAMYYELLSAADSDLFADGNQVYVVIWNTGDTVLSITDIKFAYEDATAQAVEFLYSAELASVAAATISEYEDQTYLKRIGEDWCYCDSNGEVIVYSGLVQTQDSGIWYVVDGKVNFSYSGLYRTEAGERYSLRSGRVETTLNGIAERDGQWLYFTSGRVDTDFTGIASYGDSGEWYVLNGEVQVSNSETITLNGVTYTLENGKVISNS